MVARGGKSFLFCTMAAQIKTAGCKKTVSCGFYLHIGGASHES